MQENTWKKASKMASSKDIENWRPGGPKIDLKWLKIDQKNDQNPKNASKLRKIEGQNVWWFLGHRKSIFFPCPSIHHAGPLTGPRRKPSTKSINLSKYLISTTLSIYMYIYIYIILYIYIYIFYYIFYIIYFTSYILYIILYVI